MWLIVGGRTKVKRIEGGRELKRHCEECKKVTTFAECDMLDRLEVFFVSLLDVTSRRLVCMTCGEDVDIEAPASAPASARAPAELPPKRLRADDPEIDDMLAALKKRIGK
jgi:hypothetical protein